MPVRRAMAIRWMIAFVEPPSASTVVIALSKDARSACRRLQVLPDHLHDPAARCARHLACRESTAGIDAAPGNVKPSASAALVMVEAVPIVMQWPGERAMPFFDLLPVRLGDLAGAQVRPVLPDVAAGAQRSPPPMAAQHRPGGKKIAGRFMRWAPISRPGVVLSHPPISTAPSIGYDRSSSSVSIASRLRYSIVVGFWNVSDTTSRAPRPGSLPPATRRA